MADRRTQRRHCIAFAICLADERLQKSLLCSERTDRLGAEPRNSIVTTKLERQARRECLQPRSGANNYRGNLRSSKALTYRTPIGERDSIITAPTGRLRRRAVSVGHPRSRPSGCCPGRFNGSWRGDRILADASSPDVTCAVMRHRLRTRQCILAKSTRSMRPTQFDPQNLISLTPPACLNFTSTNPIAVSKRHPNSAESKAAGEENSGRETPSRRTVPGRVAKMRIRIGRADEFNVTFVSPASLVQRILVPSNSVRLVVAFG